MLITLCASQNLPHVCFTQNIQLISVLNIESINQHSGPVLLSPMSCWSASCLCVCVTAAGPSVMASGVTGSVSVALHPLVILNISDHWIRIRSQEGRPMQGTCGDVSWDGWRLRGRMLCLSSPLRRWVYWGVSYILCCSVIGALIGKQEGRNIEVMNSFELLSHTIDDRVHIDKEYYYTKEEQCE